MSGHGTKRKKKYMYQSGKKMRIWGQLDVGMTGFLLTCNNREKEVVREAYNLLDHYGNTLYPDIKVGTNNCEVKR